MHNLSLKQRYAHQGLRDRMDDSATIAHEQLDPDLNPEEYLSIAQTRRRLQAVVDALREAGQNCLRLRAEGPHFQEIALVLRISLGSISVLLTRSIERPIRADGR